MMKNKLLFFFFLFFGVLLTGNVMAQVPTERSKEIVNIGGKEYYMHHVKSGQTLYRISLVYNVSIKEIETFNPQVKNGLKAGHVLGIPVRPEKEIKMEEPVSVEPEPVVEPEPEPVAEEPIPEPTPEPEPVAVEPEPEPVVMEPEPIPEPEPEPVVEEPTPEPVVIESEPEPVVLEPEPVVVEPEPEPVVIEPEPVVTVPVPVVKVGGHYTVQANEDLYDIAKKFGIDIGEFKAANPKLSNTPSSGTTILVPNIVNENDYIVHKCEFNERTSTLLKRWKIDEDEFRAMNVSVGSHVFVNQAVLIPIEPVKHEREEVEEPIVEEVQEETPLEPEAPTINYYEPLETPVCYADPANAKRHYKVALMVPLYLNEVSDLEVSKEGIARLQKSRSMTFLPFYEGFMMAAERMTEEEGLKLDLTVFDVTDNASTAERALQKIGSKEFDLIVGPFFSRSFGVVEAYAKEHEIPIVNPLSTRAEVTEGNANVIKVKPSHNGQILNIAYLVRNHYPDANVFILSREKVADSLFLGRLEHELNLAVNDEVTVSGDDFMQYARSESQRLEMGSRLVSTITVEGQVYSTNDLKNGSLEHVVLANPVHRYAYNSENLRLLISQLSGVRDNVIIAYGDDNVFATQVLNTLKKEADRVPITLVCAPDWTEFEKLLVDNLLQMNAIYLTDNFVDYQTNETKRFVQEYRRKYAVEPQNYAFEGYDIACYFLTALMRYGDAMMGCLPYFKMTLLHTQYHFMHKGVDSGLENQNWIMYQYDNEDVELTPVDPFKKPTE